MSPAELQALRDLPSASDRFEWVGWRATNHELREGLEAYRRYNALLGNLQDAATVLTAQADGKSITQFRVHIYGAKKRKAWLIVSDRHFL